MFCGNCGTKLKDGKCLLICSDENCLNCSMNNSVEVCYKCKEGYKNTILGCIKND